MTSLVMRQPSLPAMVSFPCFDHAKGSGYTTDRLDAPKHQAFLPASCNGPVTVSAICLTAIRLTDCHPLCIAVTNRVCCLILSLL